MRVFRSLRYALCCLIFSAAFSNPALAQQKLDYRQTQALKDATYYLDQTDGILQQIEERSKDWKVGDSKVPITDVDNLISNSERITQYMKNAKDRFANLPNHPSVNAEIDRFNAVLARLNASNKKLADVKAGLMGVVNKGGGEEYKNDFARLQEINQMYANPEMIYNQPEETIEIIKQLPNVKAERARIAEKYADLLNQPTGDAERMKGVLSYFDDVMKRFTQRADQFANESPAAIKQELDFAAQQAETAVANKTPAYFGPEGGITQRLGFAKTRIDVLTALRPDSNEAKSALAAYEATKAKVADTGKTLEADMLAANRIPTERYSGSDKDQLIAIIKDKWQAEGNGAEPMQIGMNSAGWKRDTRWEWSSGDKAWYKIDKSKTQGFVVCKHNDEIAAIWYVNLVKDHLAEDRITAYFFNDPKSPPELNYSVLMKNVN